MVLRGGTQIVVDRPEIAVKCEREFHLRSAPSPRAGLTWMQSPGKAARESSVRQESGIEAGGTRESRPQRCLLCGSI